MAKKLLVLCMAAIMAVAALVAGCGSTEQKAASDSKVLKVGTNADFAPFEFQDENGKEYQGFDMDLIRAIGEEMGYKVSMIEFTPLEHTSKNIMIKAVKGVPYKKLQQKAADEYSRLKELYNVNPAIDMLKKD